MDIQKINLKVTREGKEGWVHFCYVAPKTKLKFDALVNVLKQSPNHWVNKWAREQFDLEVDTWEDLDTLKAEIRASYKLLYPDIFVDSNTDNQGWLRVWYTQNMELELIKYGK